MCYNEAHALEKGTKMAFEEFDKDGTEELEERTQVAEGNRSSSPHVRKPEKADDEVATITLSKKTLWLVLKVAVAIALGFFIAFAMPSISYWLACLPIPTWWFVGIVVAAAGTAWACLKK